MLQSASTRVNDMIALPPLSCQLATGIPYVGPGFNAQQGPRRLRLFPDTRVVLSLKLEDHDQRSSPAHGVVTV